MSKPAFLTEEQSDRLRKMSYHIHELKMLVNDRRLDRLEDIDKNIEEPLAMMAVKILQEVMEAQSQLDRIEKLKYDIRKAESDHKGSNQTAEIFYQAMKAAYPDASLDIFLNIAERL